VDVSQCGNKNLLYDTDQVHVWDNVLLNYYSIPNNPDDIHVPDWKIKNAHAKTTSAVTISQCGTFSAVANT